MWRTQLSYFLLSLATSAFLNFIVLLFSNVDLFKVDIVKKRKENSDKMQKLTLILKNNYLFFISICSIQTLINYFLSRSLEKMIGNVELGRLKVLVILLFSFIIVTVTEIFPNYIASRESSKTLILNRFLLESAFLVTLIFSPLKFILKERKKFFTYNEEDLIRFINNLTSKEILLLEPSEAKLVNLAFNMDDKDIRNVLIPLKETVFLTSAMKTEEVIEICLERNFTKYPVFDAKGKAIGIFSIKSMFFPALKEKKIADWKLFINKKITFLEETTKLSTALETLKTSRNYFALARRDDEIVGIITLKDILGSLVGKIHDEKV